jgi:hypothetical protein
MQQQSAEPAPKKSSYIRRRENGAFFPITKALST